MKHMTIEYKQLHNISTIKRNPDGNRDAKVTLRNSQGLTNIELNVSVIMRGDGKEIQKFI